jgi:hypothetical protein
MAGLVPAISIEDASPCQLNRDHPVTARSLSSDGAKRRSEGAGPVMTTQSSLMRYASMPLRTRSRSALSFHTSICTILPPRTTKRST